MRIMIDAQKVDPRQFYLTGRQPHDDLALADLRPAVLARYHDLSALRYDYPVILSRTGQLLSLSDVVDEALCKIASPDDRDEHLRRVVLRLEREIRIASAGGRAGLLSELWDGCAAQLDDTEGKLAAKARAAFGCDGTVIDCDSQSAAMIVGHLWSAEQEDKARRFRDSTNRLVIKLRNILQSDYLRSAQGRSADSLKATFGSAHQGLFDLPRLSEMLPKSSPRDAVSDSRRNRIEWVLSVLQGQRFFPLSESVERYAFQFSSCGDALAAFRARMTEMAEVVKALTIADLEVESSYAESRHDALFANFDTTSLRPRDVAQFPDYLLLLGGEDFDYTGVLAVLSSPIPFKILIRASDLVAGTCADKDPQRLGVRSTQLATLATGLGHAFVLQSPASNLYQLRDRLRRGLQHKGPALFSVYAGSSHSKLPAYLEIAAAMQSRAFPAFSYDPGAGKGLAARFSLENNPEPGADWAAAPLEYADAGLQRVCKDEPFTFADFLFCNHASHHHFLEVSADFDRSLMTPVAEWSDDAADEDAVPFVTATDSHGRLSQIVVDRYAIRASNACLEAWHHLQDLAGRAAAAQVPGQEAEPDGLGQPDQATEPPAVEQAAAAADQAEEHDPDEAFIETERCSTCNECTRINNRMFAYNANKQAYIADVAAGTFAQLVEAAENCQLGIIHPGKPVNPGEPGLADLERRAEAFR